MKLLAWLRRDRVAELTTNDGLQERLKYALHAEGERLFPGTNGELFDAREVVRSHCQPIPCDIEDNYVCAAHRTVTR